MRSPPAGPDSPSPHQRSGRYGASSCTFPSLTHVGCCGWCAARARYFREFDVIEVQQTFYEPPRLNTLTRWRQEAPAGFQFAIKCFQLVTHEATSPTYRRLRRAPPPPATVGSFRDTTAVRAAWKETVAAAQALGAKIVLLQTPRNFTPTDEHLRNLEAFVCWARYGHDLLLAFEPRGAAWAPEDADRLCRRLHLLRGGDPFTMPAPPPRAQPIGYFRLHGLSGYQYAFTDADLRWLAQQVRGYEEAWVLFNNMSMWDDARRFKRLLARSV